MDANTAESSPALDSTSEATVDLGSLSAADRHSWRMTGTIPDPAPTADSPPAEPAAQVASTDASPSPASAAGTPSKGESRKEQLAVEIQDLLAKRHTVRDEWTAFEQWKQSQAKTDVPPVPSTGPKAASGPPLFPEFPAWAEHNPEGTYEQYFDERNDFRAEQRYQQQQAQAQAERERTERAARGKAFETRYAEAITADPTFAASLSPQVAGLVPIDALPKGQQIAALNVIGQEILISPIAPLLMRHLSAHPEEFAELASLPTPDAITRRIGKLEARLETGPSSVERPVKTVTDAPAPPPTLGRRAAIPADAVADALVRDDFRAYRDSKNAQESARVR
jgi:hypothetical protein